ncbi:hypothetical protein HanIR_Chr09g0424341 [Helianthus annuus]|nr:hypothetical protein HanIR_Chr09g0424341 [Helianthus annuus]
MKPNLSSNKPFNPPLKLFITQFVNNVDHRFLHRSFNFPATYLRLRPPQLAVNFLRTLTLLQLLTLTSPVNFQIQI